MSDEKVFAKCAWRLIPLMGLLYAVNLLDRINVGFAALTMNQDLGFSPTIFGFGAGIFSIGFLVFQVPSTIMLERIGPRRWIAIILTAWGALSAAGALVQGPMSFYVVRFLLGVAEAGFFPGMILYMSYWFPRAYRARLIATFMIAVPVSRIFGGPLSSIILQMDGVAGLDGWRWLFLIEGSPACLLALAVLKFLPDGPAHATFLTRDEKTMIAERLAAEETPVQRDVWPALRDPRVLALGLVIFGTSLGSDGLSLWLPLIVQGMGVSNFANGFVVAVPSIAGACAMLLWARSSDRRGERVRHVALAELFAASGFALAAFAPSDPIMFLGLIFAVVGINAAYGPFYTLPSTFLAGPAAAGGIALIYSIGNLGSFAGPMILGISSQETGSYSGSMLVFSFFLIVAATTVLLLGRTAQIRAALTARTP
jgi:ACS family tartrate transporter-like MFS transporter